MRVAAEKSAEPRVRVALEGLAAEEEEAPGEEDELLGMAIRVARPGA